MAIVIAIWLEDKIVIAVIELLKNNPEHKKLIIKTNHLAL